jgi:mannose-1-phosphate guanylyltransferase/phosphomannomutase
LKAVILAGGPGTRLRPLTCTRPKILIPIANRPLLDWTVERLSWAGVSEVVLAVNYLAESIRRFFGRGRYGVKVKYSLESRAMGTAGPVKLAEKLLNLEDDEVLLIMNGDLWSDVEIFKLSEFHKHHMAKGAVTTITLYEVEDVSRYGVVDLHSDGRILGFHEKPSKKVKSRLINAGIYASSKEIFSYLEERKMSFEKEVFPRLAREGKLYGLKHEGNWGDIGKIEDYLAVNFKVLEGLAKDKPRIEGETEIDSTAKIIPPVILGDNVKIGRGAIIGPYVIVGRNCVINEDCRLEKSLLMDNVQLESKVFIKGSILGEGIYIGKGGKVTGGCVLGDLVIISNNVKISRRVYICPRKEVDKNIIGPKRVI